MTAAARDLREAHRAPGGARSSSPNAAPAARRARGGVTRSKRRVARSSPVDRLAAVTCARATRADQPVSHALARARRPRGDAVERGQPLSACTVRDSEQGRRHRRARRPPSASPTRRRPPAAGARPHRVSMAGVPALSLVPRIITLLVWLVILPVCFSRGRRAAVGLRGPPQLADVHPGAHFADPATASSVLGFLRRSATSRAACDSSPRSRTSCARR